MRRRLELFIPIVLFALLVQLVAPIGAFRAVARSVSDPLAMASICSGMASASEHQNAPDDRPAGPCCGFCCAQGAAMASADAAPAVTPWQPEYQRVNWREQAGMASTVRPGSNAQARAPPVLS